MRRTRRLPWRIARVVAIVVASIFALYVLVANALLSSHAIARLLSKHPERLRLEYASARTFWPGRVHLAGFDLRGRESKIEWQLHLDAADADISLLALLGHRFHVEKVDVKGATFRARFRLEADAIPEDRAARLPPIDGFAAVPILGDPPDSSGPHGQPWIVDIQRVDTEAVREVWVDAYRVTGLVHVAGGFTIGKGHLEVGPAIADVESVTLSTGEDAIATNVEGRLDTRIDDVDLANTQGLAILRAITLHTLLRGTFGGIKFVRHFAGGGDAAFDGGAGVFRTAANIERGVLSQGSSSVLELEPATVAFGPRRISGRTRLALSTDLEGSGGVASKLDVGLSGISFTSGTKRAAAECAALKASARLPPLDLTDPLPAVLALAYSWEAERIDLLDLRAIDEALPKEGPFHIEAGTATVSTRGEGTFQGASAQAGIDSALTMKIEGARVASGAAGPLSMKADFAAGTLDLSGTELKLSDPALAGWWSKVKLDAAKVHFVPPSVSLALSVTARDGRPFLSFYGAMAETSLVAKTALEVVPNPVVESMTADLSGRLRCSASRGVVEIGGIDVHGAASRLRGSIRRRGGRMSGGLLIEAGPTALGISFDTGNARLVLANARPWFAARDESE